MSVLTLALCARLSWLLVSFEVHINSLHIIIIIIIIIIFHLLLIHGVGQIRVTDAIRPLMTKDLALSGQTCAPLNSRVKSY